MSSAIELVESHPWRLAAVASIPIFGAAVPLYLHVNNQITEDLYDIEREQINKTRNITAGVQVLACGALAGGAYVAAKVGLAILLKISVGALITFLGVASGFILPAVILLTYLSYKAISYWHSCSTNSGSHSQTSAIGDASYSTSSHTSFFADSEDDSDYEEIDSIDNNEI